MSEEQEIVVITSYMCPTCRETFAGRFMAEACREKGPAVEYPSGTIFINDDFPHHGKAFAVARNLCSGHRNVFTVWITHPEESKALDIRPHDGPECAHYGVSQQGRLTAKEAVTTNRHPAVSRMVAALSEAGIAPLIWDGAKSVPYLEWLAQFKDGGGHA